MPVLRPDPTTPGTRAHLRWHKDDSPRAMREYENQFETPRLLHEFEVCDSELPRDAVKRRADSRLARGAGHTHERQPPTFGNFDGLLGKHERDGVFVRGRSDQ